jgi:N-acyl-L-homoserine lactone synthetase
MSDLQVLVCTTRSDINLLTAIHQLRYRVFKDRLDWDVAVSGGMEMDHYDILGPTYLALVDGDREVLGCARLLPTTGPNMLANTFPILLGDTPAPRAADVWESSRFCIDTARVAAKLESGLRQATPAILAGMTEWCLSRGISSIVTVTDLIVERVLRRAGCPMARLGAPMRVGKTTAVAGSITVSTGLLADIRAAGGFSHAMIRTDVPAELQRRRA